jgi:F420-dependent oxidoreductase-like protein
MSATRPLSFGFKTAPQHCTYEEILPIWKEADAQPALEHAWLFDHFNPIVGDVAGPCLEGYTALAALAASTERLRLGLMVAGNTYRHPAVAAHMAATIDIVSGGRFDFGIGAGWNVYEHESMGLELYAPGERIRRFGEACEIAKRLFTEDAVTFEGRYYRLNEARLEPKPVQKPHPPFVIGGGGEQLTLRVVAQYADIWNHGGGDVETFTHKVKVLHEHCAAIGRDPNEIELSVQWRLDYADFPGAAEVLRGFVAAGATHVVFYLATPYPAGIIGRLVDDLIPRIRG